MLACLKRSSIRNRNISVRSTRYLIKGIQLRYKPQDVATQSRAGKLPLKHSLAKSGLSSSNGEKKDLQTTKQEKHSRGQKSGSSPESISHRGGAGSVSEWLEALEPFLPVHLRAQRHARAKSPVVGRIKIAASLTDLLSAARSSESSFDPLTELGIRYARWPAVAWLLEKLVAGSSLSPPSSLSMPSNLCWPPGKSLARATSRPFEVGTPTPQQAETPQDGLLDTLSGEGKAFPPQSRSHLEQVWMSIGSIVLRAEGLPAEQQTRAMACVHRTIGLLHKRGLIPDQIYANPTPTHGTFISRSPLLHLLSSTILTIISDASWHAYRDEWIVSAVESGQSRRDAERTAPGLPIKLPVRHLTSEVWLELALCCCLDCGFLEAGCWIIEQSRTLKDFHPWTAVRHTLPSDQLGSTHSGEIANSRKHTISVEVLLGFTESLMEIQGFDMAQDSSDLSAIPKMISNLVRFLEPHDLSPEYLDYISVRLSHLSLLSAKDEAAAQHALGDTVREIRSFARQERHQSQEPTMALNSIFEQTEVFPGMLHQSLESFCTRDRLHPTLEIFKTIQQLTDQSKLRSVGLFLKDGMSHWQLSSPSFPFSLEYTSSHGQLPAQKYASLLRLLTDARMAQSAQWLVYSTDVDGPSIPSSLYSQLSLTEPLLGLVQATGDHLLMGDIAAEVTKRRYKPSVGFLRRLVDAQLALNDLKAAGKTLALIKTSFGGGNDLRNVSSIMAMIIRLEKPSSMTPSLRSSPRLSHAVALLDWVLQGDFRSITGDFRADDIQAYRRGLSCLLRVAEALPGSALSQVAKLWIPKFGSTNMAGLNSRVFDIVLSAVVDCRGAQEGMMLWDAFCSLEPSIAAQKDVKGLNGLDTYSVDPSSAMQRFHSRGTIGDDELPFEVTGLLGQPNSEDPRTPQMQNMLVPRKGVALPTGQFSGMIYHDTASFTSPPLSVLTKTKSKIFVVKPTFRTLGIIVRAALEELEFAKKVSYAENPNSSLNSTKTAAEANARHLEEAINQTRMVQKWAQPLFHNFGLSDEDASLEFQGLPNGQSSLFTQEELEKKLRDGQTEYELARMGMLSHLSKVNVRRNFL